MVTEISTLQELQDINNNLSGDYVLTSDIDASDTQNWNKLNWQGTWQSDTTYNENDYIEESGNYYYQLQDSYTSGSSFDSSQWVETTKFTGGSADDGEALGFRPIGDRGDFLSAFSGTFNGQGYAISDLYINRGEENNVGIFGLISNEVKELDVENITIKHDGIQGDFANAGTGIFGAISGGDILQIKGTGTIISKRNQVGGLCGRCQEGNAKNSYFMGTIEGVDRTGGLIGVIRNTNVENTYVVADVTATGDRVGAAIGVIFAVGTDEKAYYNYSYANSDITDLALVGDEGGDGTIDTTGSSLKTTAEMTDYPDYPDAYEGWTFAES